MRELPEKIIAEYLPSDLSEAVASFIQERKP